jgi:hypothetical protein
LKKKSRRVQETAIPLDRSEGVFAQTYKRGGKAAYFSRVRSGAGLEIEQFVTGLYRMEDFFYCRL